MTTTTKGNEMTIEVAIKWTDVEVGDSVWMEEEFRFVTVNRILNRSTISATGNGTPSIILMEMDNGKVLFATSSTKFNVRRIKGEVDSLMVYADETLITERIG